MFSKTFSDICLLCIATNGHRFQVHINIFRGFKGAQKDFLYVCFYYIFSLDKDINKNKNKQVNN